MYAFCARRSISRQLSSSACLNVASSGATETICPSSCRPPRKSFFLNIGPSIDYLERAFDDAKYGWYSEHPYIDCAIQSTIDPDMAPPGKHVLSCFVQYTPYHLRESDPQSFVLPRPAARLEVDRLVYVPQGADRAIIKGVSFALDAGDILAVVGPSAAGKSTLARLLVGVLAPSAGGVFLDGHNVFTWERTSFGDVVGYLPQNVALLDGTAELGQGEDRKVQLLGQLLQSATDLGNLLYPIVA